MLLQDTWFTVEEAASKFGLDREIILEWVEEGVVRCETEKGKVSLVNADDLELLMKERAHML